MTTWTDIFGGTPVNPSDVSYLQLVIAPENNPQVLSWPASFYPNTITAGHIIDLDVKAEASPIVILPNATQVSPGQDILFRNISAVSFTINASDDSFLLTIPTNTAFYIYLQDNTTVAGTWGIVQFGTGTSSADATSLAGYGLIALSNAKINVNTPVVVHSTPFTVDATSRGSIFIWTGGAYTQDLPNPALLDVGNGYIVTFHNNSTIGGSLILQNTFGNLDAGTTVELLPGSSTSVICDGSANYYTIGLGTPTFFAVGYFDLDITGLGATITLTPAQAQNIIQQYDGTLTANTEVVFPASTYFNFIFNNTSGSYTLSVLVGGGTPIVVPQGQKIIVYNNATNLVEVPSFDTDIGNQTFVLNTPAPLGLLPNAQALSVLSTGIVKNTTATGLLSIATEVPLGTLNPAVGDYYGPNKPAFLYCDVDYNFYAGYANAPLVLTSAAARNTSVGAIALQSLTTGVNNTVVGFQAGAAITDGTDNIVMGYNAGFQLTSGSQNLLLGTDAGNLLTNQVGFVAIGHGALANAVDQPCVAIGYQAGASTTAGSYNVFIGPQTGYANTTGSNNVLIGHQAGLANVTGNSLTLIGTGANVGVDGLANSTAIGINCIVGTSDTISLGYTGVSQPPVVIGGTSSNSQGQTESLQLPSGGTAGIWMQNSGGYSRPAPTVGAILWVGDGDLPNVTSPAITGSVANIDLYPQPYVAVLNSGLYGLDMAPGGTANGAITPGTALLNYLHNGYPSGYYPDAVLVIETLVFASVLTGAALQQFTAEFYKINGSGQTNYTGVPATPNYTFTSSAPGGGAGAFPVLFPVRVTVNLASVVDAGATGWGILFTANGSNTDFLHIGASTLTVNSYIITGGIN